MPHCIKYLHTDVSNSLGSGVSDKKLDATLIWGSPCYGLDMRTRHEVRGSETQKKQPSFINPSRTVLWPHPPSFRLDRLFRIFPVQKNSIDLMVSSERSLGLENTVKIQIRVKGFFASCPTLEEGCGIEHQMIPPQIVRPSAVS